MKKMFPKHTFIIRKRMSILMLLTIMISHFSLAQDHSHVANFYPLLDSYAKKKNSSLSFLTKDRADVETWRRNGRKKLEELLAYHPEPAALDVKVLDTIKREGYTQYLVQYNLNSLQQTEAFLLIPDNLNGKAPAVIALHDHGGFYFYGKEKITQTDNRPGILKDFILNLYEGQPYADELAKRGFVVLCPDAMYFGSQKIDPSLLLEDKSQEYFNKLPENENDAIKAFNKLAGEHEIPVKKTILTAGTTWLGIIVQGDKVAIDFLLSRPEVDPEKIACIGLSLGGLRSTYLFGLDSRIKVGVVSCFSTTYQEMLKEHVRHTWMMYVPGQYRYLDLPDVASLNAPRPLFIQNGNHDHLFNIKGMKAAEKKLSAVYQKMNAPDKFKTTFYDKPHVMDIEMQEDAFEWLEKWLK